ncbi:MAG TPA: nuclear transport factor 2 family protein [Hyphomicrobiaceae bacterium]|nr:nuclear transport factor 2 family protein [Hyphomicrobiaceae bacterium]
MQSARRVGTGVFVLALLPALAALAHPPAILSDREEKATAEEVIEFRKTVVAAIERKDAAALRRIYANGFVHTHGSGKVDGKDARIVQVLAGDPAIETAPVSDLVIRVPGGWTAIATGVSPIRSLADGKTYSFRWTVVYVRMGESWQIAASQATRLPDAK